MTKTTSNGNPYPEDTDAPDGPTQIKALAEALNSIPAKLLASECVETAKIKNLAVTAAKIAEATITKAKLATNARPMASYSSISVGETFFFEQKTYKFMDSIEEIVVPANATIEVAYSAMMRGGASGATHYAAIFVGAAQLMVPANTTLATPTAQEMSFVAGVNFSTAWTYVYSKALGLFTPGVNVSAENKARVECEAIGVSGVDGGSVLIRGIPAGTYEIGVKMKSTENYTRAKERHLRVNIYGNGS